MLKFSSKRDSFSLVEVLVVTAIGSMLVFVLTSFSGNIGILKNLVNQKLQSRSDIEQTLQIMTTEIRSASHSSLGGYAIDSASSSYFIFYSDIDNDGFFDRVRYFLVTSTIQKGVIRPSGNPIVYSTSSEIIATVVNNLANTTSSKPLFNYYDSSYTGTQDSLANPIDVTKVRVIQISFDVDINTSTAPKAESFTATVDVRNLKTN